MWQPAAYLPLPAAAETKPLLLQHRVRQDRALSFRKSKKDGKLVVGTAPGFPPYEFLDTSVKDKKSITGIDIKIAEAVAKKLGVKLEVQDMTFQSLLASITTGKIDIAISAITPTAEREKTVDFSDSYLVGKHTLLVRKEDAGKYKTLSDFNGKRSPSRSLLCRKS